MYAKLYEAKFTLPCVCIWCKDNAKKLSNVVFHECYRILYYVNYPLHCCAILV